MRRGKKKGFQDRNDKGHSPSEGENKGDHREQVDTPKSTDIMEGEQDGMGGGRMSLAEQRAILFRYAECETEFVMDKDKLEREMREWSKKILMEEESESGISFRQLVEMSEAKAKLMRGRWKRVPEDPEELEDNPEESDRGRNKKGS